MAKKQKYGRIVYSTDPDFEQDPEEPDIPETPPPGQQELRIWLERRGGGKKVSVIKGYTGDPADARDIAKNLKSICGVGGSFKNGEILIQGDQRDKIVDYLVSEGYSAKKSGG